MFLKLLLITMAATFCFSCADQNSVKENVYRGLYDGLTAQYPDRHTQIMGDSSHQNYQKPLSYDQYCAERKKLLQESNQEQK